MEDPRQTRWQVRSPDPVHQCDQSAAVPESEMQVTFRRCPTNPTTAIHFVTSMRTA